MASIGPDETVLEVGPGLGSLTLGLLDAAKAVVAVEIDPVLAAKLPETVRTWRPEAGGLLPPRPGRRDEGHGPSR